MQRHLMQTPMSAGQMGHMGHMGPGLGGQTGPGVQGQHVQMGQRGQMGQMGGQMGQMGAQGAQGMMRPVARQAVPNKRKRPTDKILAKKLEEYVPEAKLYNQMMEFEKKLDSTITRKILDLQDSLAKPEPVKKTLRIFLSNLSSNQYDLQPMEETDLSASLDVMEESIPSWTLRIQGKMIDPPNAKKILGQPPKFSNFIKKIVVELKRDEVIYPNGNIIEWEKRPGDPETDGFEIKRQGDSDTPARILVYLDRHPEKFKLSPALGHLLDIQVDTMSNVLLAIWQYVKVNKLLDQEDSRCINCDEPLANIFGTQKIMFAYLPELLVRHLLPCDPIVLDYTIKVDKEHNYSNVAYDIDVELENPIRDRIKMITQKHGVLQRELAVLDEQISALVQSIHESKSKRDFMKSFASDPVTFLNSWVGSQSRDLEVILGDSRLNREEVEHSEFWTRDRIKESLFHYLSERGL